MFGHDVDEPDEPPPPWWFLWVPIGITVLGIALLVGLALR